MLAVIYGLIMEFLFCFLVQTEVNSVEPPKIFLDPNLHLAISNGPVWFKTERFKEIET